MTTARVAIVLKRALKFSLHFIHCVGFAEKRSLALWAWAILSDGSCRSSGPGDIPQSLVSTFVLDCAWRRAGVRPVLPRPRVL